MRQLLALLAALVLLSGCLEDAPSDEPLDEAPATVAPPAAPEPLHWEADVTVGADPFNVVLAECSTPASACDLYDFTIDQTVDVQAVLAWGIPANDLDLYLYKGETFLSNDGINFLGDPPGPASQTLRHAQLAPGTYTFRVVMWNAVADHYDLDVTFTAQAAAGNATW